MIDKSRIIHKICPICNNELIIEEDLFFKVKGRATSFTTNNKKVFFARCFHPCTLDPLHYYSSCVYPNKLSEILVEEMSLNLGSRSVLFSNQYLTGKSYIWSKKDSEQIELPFIIVPDYPKLTKLINRVKLSITFG